MHESRSGLRSSDEVTLDQAASGSGFTDGRRPCLRFVSSGRAGPDEGEPSRCAWARPLQACVIAFVGRALRPCDAVKVSDGRIRWVGSDSDTAQDIAPEAQRGREHVVHQYRRSASRLISSHAGCDEACKHSICCAWRKPRDGGNVRTGGETLHSATDEVRLSNRVVSGERVVEWSGGFVMVVRRPSNQMQQYGGSGELGPRACAWRASGWCALRYSAAMVCLTLQ